MNTTDHSSYIYIYISGMVAAELFWRSWQIISQNVINLRIRSHLCMFFLSRTSKSRPKKKKNKNKCMCVVIDLCWIWGTKTAALLVMHLHVTGHLICGAQILHGLIYSIIYLFALFLSSSIPLGINSFKNYHIKFYLKKRILVSWIRLSPLIFYENYSVRGRFHLSKTNLHNNNQNSKYYYYITLYIYIYELRVIHVM